MSVIVNGPVSGMSDTDQAYINAAKTAVPDASNLIPDAPSNGSSYARKNSAWEVVSVGASIGNWSVDGSDTFTLDKTGTNPANLKMQSIAPYSLGSIYSENIQRSANTTITDNTVKNWGWNIGVGGGIANASFPATYLQLESNFELTAGIGWSEYHLNIFTTGGAATRPFQFNMRHTDGYVSANYRGDTTIFQDNAGLVNYLALTTPASGNGLLTIAKLPTDINNVSTSAFKVQSTNGILIEADTTNNRVNVGGGVYTGKFNVLGESKFYYNPAATSGAQIAVSTTVTASHAATSSGDVRGSYFAVTNGSASNLAKLTGMEFVARNDAAGVVAEIFGINMQVGTLTSRTATSVTGIFMTPYIPGTSSFWTGMEIASPTGAGTVFMYGHRIQNLGKSGMNTCYGIKIENQSGAGSNFAIYTGTGTVWFGDSVYIGTGKILLIGNQQVVGARVIDARCDDAINSGDATTDGVIDALRDAMITHGLIAAA